MRPLRWAVMSVTLLAACAPASRGVEPVRTTSTTTAGTTSTAVLPSATTTTTVLATSTPSPTEAATTTTTTAPEPRAFTIAAAGDVLIHEALADAAAAHAGGDGYDFFPLLAPVAPWISYADLAICHLEGTLSPDNTGLLYQTGQDHPALFNAPHEVAEALAAAGFDACSTASNHSFDRGSVGVYETLDVLDAAGIRHAGTARSPEERAPRIYEVKGVKVGHLSYTFGTNVGVPSRERLWELDLLDADAILADAAAVRADGAEFVVLSLHWGVEYEPLPAPSQSALAERLLGSPDLDLILGHHSHVVSPIDWIGDKVVVYGMGNFISNIRGLPDGTKVGGEDGMIVHVLVEEGEDGRFTVREVLFTPIWVHPQTKELLVVAEALAGDSEAYEAALRASWERTVDRALLFEPERVEVWEGSPTPSSD